MIRCPASPRNFSARPEGELLLTCALVRMDAEGVERIQKFLQGDLDGSTFFEERCTQA